MKEVHRILVIDDEENVRTLIEGRLLRHGFAVRVAASGEEALAQARDFDPHAAVTDLRMPGMDGFEVISQLKIPTLIITGHGDKESAVRAVESGAFAFFEKPFDLDQLEIMVRRAAEKRLMDLEKEMLLKRLDRLCKLQGREIESLERPHETTSFVGENQRMLEVKHLLTRMAQKPHAGLLILGETGTGKEVVARELHRLTHPKSTSDTGRTPFLALNCSAIPADLLESELFGHEKGAFSGAQNMRIGLAEAVREGTLFLDEIGELDPRHQAKILRLIQERKFRRVGANTEINFQGRIAAATHRDLPTLAKEGRFREDLYYRLSVVSVVLPPLRERRDDLARLAQTLCAKHGLTGVHPDSMKQVLTHEWPGNVRELNNWIERASILGLHDEDDRVTSKVEFAGTANSTLSSPTNSTLFPPANSTLSSPTNSILPSSASSSSGSRVGLANETGDLKSLRNQILDEYDRKWIEKALEESEGNVSATAKRLGIDRKNLARRMKDLGIKKAA